MSVLELSKKIQKLIGIYRENSEDPREQKFPFYMIMMNIIFLFGMFGILIFGSIAYIYENPSDLEKSTNSMICSMAGSSGVGCYGGILLNLKSTQKLFSLLQQLADESKIKNVP